MKSLSLLQVKNMEIEMLAYIESICTANKIRYYAAYGTLLGAVRHQGFIPWDDDIDLYMPRNDFEKFKELIDNNDSPFSLLTLEKDHYNHAFAKLVDNRTILIESDNRAEYDLGVYIDIFILDGLPDDMRQARKHFKKCHRLSVVLYGLENNSYPKGMKGVAYVKALVAWLSSGVISTLKVGNHLKKKFCEYALRYPYDKSNTVFPEGCCYGINEIYSKSVFETIEYLPFEGTSIPVPKGYIECLTKCYGNYMELPPKEQQVARHDFEAYWKD